MMASMDPHTEPTTMFYVIMGVCGCGKTTVGKKLAEQLHLPFNDADDFHSSTNKAKMNKGISLTDEDRLPWLISIHGHMKRHVDSNQGGIVACSALKKMYRKVLVMGNSNITTDAANSLEDNVTFVFLKGSASVTRDRLLKRTNHFMHAGLLDSQLSILEEPDDEKHCVVVNADRSVEDIIHDVLSVLQVQK